MSPVYMYIYIYKKKNTPTLRRGGLSINNTKFFANCRERICAKIDVSGGVSCGHLNSNARFT